jgi:hypothetical protein
MGRGEIRTRDLGIKSPAQRAARNYGKLKDAATGADRRCNELKHDAARGDKPLRRVLTRGLRLIWQRARSPRSAIRRSVLARIHKAARLGSFAAIADAASPRLSHCSFFPVYSRAFEFSGACRLGVPRTLALSDARGYARPVSESEKPFGWRTGSAEGSNSEPTPDRVYEPPRLRAVGTLAELVRGVVGQSDGLGPGSALEAGQVPPPVAP